MNYFNIYILLFYNILVFIFCNNCFEYSCEECSDSNYDSCTKCKEGFNLLDGTCPCYDPECNICRTSSYGNSFVYFNENYYNLNGKCQCQFKNCEICGSNKCLKCLNGYILDDDDKNCIKKSIDFNIKCLDSHCLYCENRNEETCRTCIKGYEETKGYCKKLSYAVNNYCYDYNYYPNKNDNYCHPKCNGATCFSPIFNSKFKQCSNSCLKCFDNELFFIKDCFNVSIKNCNYQITKDDCYFCNTGYYRKLGNCVKCPKGCKKCSNRNKCIICDNTYTLLNNGSCELVTNNSNENEQLRVKNFLDSYKYIKSSLTTFPLYKNGIKENYFCEVSNCLHCSYKNKCLLCGNNYVLDNNGKCLKKNCSIEHCKNCSSQNICDSCEENYILNNNKCEIKYDIKDCETSNHLNICSKCKKDYIFNTYLKEQISCSEFDILENNFSECKNNFKNLKENGDEIENDEIEYEEYYIKSIFCNNFDKCLKCKNNYNFIDYCSNFTNKQCINKIQKKKINH